MSGDTNYLLKTGGTAADKLAVADDVVNAVMDVAKLDSDNISQRVHAAAMKQKIAQTDINEMNRLTLEYSEGRAPVAAMGTVTMDKWRQMFHPQRMIEVVEWDENKPECWERLWMAEAGGKECAFIGYRPFPLGPSHRADYNTWVSELAVKTQWYQNKELLDCGPMDEKEDDGVVILKDTDSFETFKKKSKQLRIRRHRSVLQLPDYRRNQTNADMNELCEWEVCNYREAAGNELLEIDKLRDPLAIVDAGLISGEQKAIFLTHGPSCNSAHVDSIGGASCLVFGWKVFVMWDAKEWTIGVGQWVERMGDIAPAIPINDFIRFPSLRWTLIGPNSSVIIPADRPHFVITFTSALLIAYSSTTMPHRLMRAIGLTLAGQLPTRGTWLDPRLNQAINVVTPFVEYLRVRLEAVVGQWSEHRKQVARREWAAVRWEIKRLIQMAPIIDCLMAFRDLDDAYEE